MSQIRKLFLDVHMGLSHDGLNELARKNKVKPETLATGDLLMFINRKGDKMKVLGAHGMVIGYLRMPKHRPISIEALQYVPETFGGSAMEYDSALRQMLVNKLRRKVNLQIKP